MSNRIRIFFAGLLISALAIAGYLTLSSEDEPPQDHSDVKPYDASASGAPDDSMNGSSNSGLVSSDGSLNADIAPALQAVRNSLQRNDLDSAKVLLDAEQNLHQDDEQVLALQKELHAREDEAAGAPPVARVDKPPKTLEPTRPPSQPSARVGVHDSSLRVREQAADTTRHARGFHTPEVKVSPQKDVNVVAASPASGSGETASTSSQTTATVASAPARTESIDTTQSNAHDIQAIPSNSMATVPDQGPKTRAQVRSELAHARADGSLPRFGNPDPAGPGGLPGSTAHLTAATP